MTHYEQDELALLLLMVDSAGGGRQITETQEEAAAHLLYEPNESNSWYLSPGRCHLPAEFGGRVAEELPEPRKTTSRRGDLLREYGVGECLTEFSPLQYDHKTLSYTGTIFWDTSEVGGIV